MDRVAFGFAVLLVLAIALGAFVLGELHGRLDRDDCACSCQRPAQTYPPWPEYGRNPDQCTEPRFVITPC